MAFCQIKNYPSPYSILLMILVEEAISITNNKQANNFQLTISSFVLVWGRLIITKPSVPTVSEMVLRFL